MLGAAVLQGAHLDAARCVMGAGVAVGGLAPLLVARAFSSGWRLWLVQCAVLVAWSFALAWEVLP